MKVKDRRSCHGFGFVRTGHRSKFAPKKNITWGRRDRRQSIDRNLEDEAVLALLCIARDSKCNVNKMSFPVDSCDRYQQEAFESGIHGGMAFPSTEEFAKETGKVLSSNSSSESTFSAVPLSQAQAQFCQAISERNLSFSAQQVSFDQLSSRNGLMKEKRSFTLAPLPPQKSQYPSAVQSPSTSQPPVQKPNLAELPPASYSTNLFQTAKPFVYRPNFNKAASQQNIKDALEAASAAAQKIQDPPPPTPKVRLELANHANKARTQTNALQRQSSAPEPYIMRGGRLIVTPPSSSNQPNEASKANSSSPVAKSLPSPPQQMPGQLKINYKPGVGNQTGVQVSLPALTLHKNRPTSFGQAVLQQKVQNNPSLWQNTLKGGNEDESSEETIQPNWGLNLFSVLNPTVITTGHCAHKDDNRAEK